MKMMAFGLSFGVLAPVLPTASAYAAETAGKKPLVVYFSMPETDNPHNMRRDEANSVVVVNGNVLGNTQYVARLIQEMTGGDIFRSLGIPDLDAALPSPNPNAGALSDLRSFAPRASLAEGLVVRGSVVREVRKNVEAWVSRLTILKN